MGLLKNDRSPNNLDFVYIAIVFSVQDTLELWSYMCVGVCVCVCMSIVELSRHLKIDIRAYTGFKFQVLLQKCTSPTEMRMTPANQYIYNANCK